MKRDFTLNIFEILLHSIKQVGYDFCTFSGYIKEKRNNIIILRHDVDRIPINSMITAKLENAMGIKGSYYFRVGPGSWNQNIIISIAELHHEIGYHYENMDTCHGNHEKAWDDFRRNLDKFREIVPVTSICMHGSPLSKFDNKALWDKYDYRSLGIIGEPYLDINFNEVAYLTDTGRRWNGSSVSIRDKVNSSYNLDFRSTREIISNVSQLPGKVMFTFHPQRWTNNPVLWTQELIFQNFKNVIKSFYTP